MTDTALSPFEDHEVVEAAIEIPNAAGGLQDAMEIDPQEFHHGERRTIVLDVVVKKVRFDPIKDTGNLRRVHVFSAESATFIDRAVVAGALDEQTLKIAQARSAAEEAAKALKGEEAMRKNMGLLSAEELADEHLRGDHASGLVNGCSDCDLEAEAEKEEARESVDA